MLAYICKACLLMHARVCGLYLISALCHHLICGLPSFWFIVLVSPMHKDLRTAWADDSVCRLLHSRGGGGEKARKVKIKSLWTNSLFDQAAQRWMDFSAKSRRQLREERCFRFISPRLPFFFFPLIHIVVSFVYSPLLCYGECQASLSWLHTNTHMHIQWL